MLPQLARKLARLLYCASSLAARKSRIDFKTHLRHKFLRSQTAIASEYNSSSSVCCFQSAGLHLVLRGRRCGWAFSYHPFPSLIHTFSQEILWLFKVVASMSQEKRNFEQFIFQKHIFAHVWPHWRHVYGSSFGLQDTYDSPSKLIN